MPTQRRAVVVGLGSIGRRHAGFLLERDDLSVEVLETRSETLDSALSDLGQLRSFNSFEQVLDTSPDIVWIATPTPLHASQAIAALEAGAHVFCEKPMSDRVADALRVKEAADRSRRVFNVGYMLHFSPGLLALRELVQKGELGQILHAHVRMGAYLTLANAVSRYQASQEGSLFFDYSHQPDIFYWLLGEAPTNVQVTALQAGEMECSSNPNIAVVTCQYSSRMIATMHLDYIEVPQRHEYEIIGDKGWAVVSLSEGTMSVGRRDTREVRHQMFPGVVKDLYRAEHQAFFEAVDGLREPESPAAQGLVSVAVCEAAKQSWKTGKPLAVTIGAD